MVFQLRRLLILSFALLSITSAHLNAEDINSSAAQLEAIKSAEAVLKDKLTREHRLEIESLQNSYLMIVGLLLILSLLTGILTRSHFHKKLILRKKENEAIIDEYSAKFETMDREYAKKIDEVKLELSKLCKSKIAEKIEQMKNERDAMYKGIE